jgi:hypothetical protein
MQDATENKDISATQAALAESMAQLQMISKMRGKHPLMQVQTHILLHLNRVTQ